MDHISNFLPSNYEDDPEGFFWPVHRDEVVKTRDRFLKSLLKHANTNNDSDPYADYYFILSLHWSNHVVQFYHFLKAKAEFEKCGVSPYLEGDSGFFRDICDGVMPPMPPYLDRFYQGIKPQTLWLEPARIIRSFLSPNSLSRKPLFAVNLKKDIVVSSAGLLILKHAKMMNKMGNKTVCYLPRSVWFKPINTAVSDGVINCEPLLAIVNESFGSEAYLITDVTEQWFKEFFTKTLYACDTHVQRLLATPHKLPRNLWIGSGGIFWDRVMKYVVKKNGGHVTGHDHGGGTGHVKSISRTLAECSDCDVFIPFSDNTTLFTDAIVPEFLVGENIPKVMPLNLKKNIPSQSSTIVSSSTNPHVLIIPYGPDCNIPRFLTVPHDSVKTDFLVRTIKQLKQLGCIVSIKPHPHCPRPLTHEYLRSLDVEQIEGDIRDAFKKADIILFPSLYTTAFREAFDALKPMILIDMHYEDWADGAREKLAKRCSIIDGGYDQNGRIVYELAHLKAAIQEAPSKNDNSYYDTYYGGSV